MVKFGPSKTRASLGESTNEFPETPTAECKSGPDQL